MLKIEGENNSRKTETKKAEEVKKRRKRHKCSQTDNRKIRDETEGRKAEMTYKERRKLGKMMKGSRRRQK